MPFESWRDLCSNIDIYIINNSLLNHVYLVYLIVLFRLKVNLYFECHL